MITYNIKINAQATRVSNSNITLTTGDYAGYRFRFTFSDIDTQDCMLILKAKRFDGVVVTAQSNTNEIVLPNNMYSVEGEVVFEVALCGENGRYVTSHVLIANVRKGHGEDAIVSDDRCPVLTSLISDVNAYKNLFECILDENGKIIGSTIADASISADKLSDELSAQIEAKADKTYVDALAPVTVTDIENPPYETGIFISEDKSTVVYSRAVSDEVMYCEAYQLKISPGNIQFREYSSMITPFNASTNGVWQDFSHAENTQFLDILDPEGALGIDTINCLRLYNGDGHAGIQIEYRGGNMPGSYGNTNFSILRIDRRGIAFRYGGGSESTDWEYVSYSKSETDAAIESAIGDIETAVDGILAIQDSLIGGENS